ncbi:MAG: hypothetical protein CL916_07340 [Deltaproteobacteria bacterium]|nr:hypothetical protein [Deltaproteobacteria bacterium]
MFATILVSVLACTQMESPGKPFSPVQISEEKIEIDSESVNVSEDKKEEINPLFEPTGSVVLVSEVDERLEIDKFETNQPQKEIIEDSSKVIVDEVQLKKETDKDPEVFIEKKFQDEQDLSTKKKEVISLEQWPLRVVKTEVGLNPPRAILGLPNGEEVVIRPGMQLPEENLVVMSIGSKAVVLARIHTEGDYARVEHLTLPSLND